MISFNKLLLVGLLVTGSNATNLKELIDSTIQNNQNLQSLKIKDQSYNKTYGSVKNSYNPTFNIGASYLQLDGDVRNVQVGQTSTGYAKLSIDLYNGGKNSALKLQKEYEYKSELKNTTTTIKETILQVVTLYFQTKTVEENLKVLHEKAVALKAQYDRIKTKYDLKMTTIDEVLKFQSEYESNNYLIEELKYQKEELIQNLSFLSNSKVINLDNFKLPEVSNLIYKESSSIDSLKYSIKAQQENKNIVKSSQKPQIKVENSYNFYNYDDYNSNLLTDLPDHQNQLILSINFKLFDTTTSDKVEAAQLVKQATQQKLEYLKVQEQMKFDLAKKRLNTLNLKINSLKSAVKMANSVYDMVKIKYENSVVDNITYLDALSKKIYNTSLYKQALNDYEIAKANYYFDSGIDYKEVLDNWK